MKRQTIIRGCAMVAAMVVTIATAPAADKEKGRPSTFVVARGSRFMPTGDLKDGGFGPEENVEVALGRYLTSFVALEGGVHHFRARYEETTPFYLRQILFADGLVLTPKLVYPGKRIELYAGFGVGHYWVENGVRYEAGISSGYYEINDTIWGYHACAGASYDLLRFLYLGLEGSYVMLGDFKDTGDLTGWALNVSIGVRFL